MSQGYCLLLLLLGKTGKRGYGMAVYGAARGHCQSKQTPSLMVDMYGFSCEEEMADTKQYLRDHSNYQLEHISGKQLVTLYFFYHFSWSL